MELWMVGNKIILLAYVIGQTYFGAGTANKILVLLFLVHIALSLLAYIVKGLRLRQTAISLDLLFLLFCAAKVQPEFALLVPLSWYELVSLGGGYKPWALIPALLPLPVLKDVMPSHYIFIAVLTFFNYALMSSFSGRADRQEERLDKQREDMQRLAAQLNERQEFMRASEYMAKLEERNRLSQEIHDGIGHAMTGALIQMEAAKTLLSIDPAKAGELLQNAIGISKEGIESIRSTLKSTKPLTEQLGFSRMQAGVEEFGRRTGMLTSIVHAGSMELITPLQWKILHENVLEALTNAGKYSGATAVHVEIRVLNRYIRAVVADNGRGSGKIVKGLGLLGMEERTAAVHGTVIADGEDGFTVTTLIPYEKKS
ncbi:sensor histidine kinase [Paenibacillus sp. NFR01]|uniref:sensor histidine kinase n=1 Tax=Paenibacillus sp. NFR01 TaxID=1566279 RepID=UPI0008C27FA0|nr:histidine kinase [Paenibacillus sp. NFR01]SES96345.1 Signal transduction histidine kinase [Paenibacillus sp. NFR01]